MARCIFLIVVIVLAVPGCTQEKRRPWYHPSIELADIDALTLIVAASAQDGGTIEIVAITGSGKRCSIRLNQHSFLGNYELGTLNSPGRLCFNERLIDVRSSEEERLISLLRDASLKPISVDDLRKLRNLDIVTPSDLDAHSQLDNNDEIKRYRDAILAYVNSDDYVDAAKHGIPYNPGTDG